MPPVNEAGRKFVTSTLRVAPITPINTYCFRIYALAMTTETTGTPSDQVG